jgi:hypothetical protein
MPRTEKYFIGPQLLGDIRRVVERVSAEPYGSEVARIPTRLQDMRRGGGGGGELLLGKPSGVTAWQKDSLRDVIIYDAGEPLLETVSSPARVIEDVVNKLITVGTNDWVIIGQVGNRWYLVAVEC